MHFQSAGFAQAVLLHEHPDVVVCGEDTVCGDTKRVRSGVDGRPPVAVHEGYGQIIPITVSKITKMKGPVSPVVDLVDLRVSVDAEIIYDGSGDRVLDQCERCLRPMPAWYPEVDYHADEGNECGYPCRRGPRKASHPMHNSIFPQKKKAAGATAATTQKVSKHPMSTSSIPAAPTRRGDPGTSFEAAETINVNRMQAETVKALVGLHEPVEEWRLQERVEQRSAAGLATARSGPGSRSWSARVWSW